jgi:3-oxoacid CoA-transferase subunit A
MSHDFNGKMCLVIGGAYSIDKEIRISNYWGWWADEQPSKNIKSCVEKRLKAENWNVDIVLTHTCPYKYLPREIFTENIFNVDYTTERWLDKIEKKLAYSRWYCGHYHTEKTIDKMRFLYNDFLELK